jgi:integrase
MTQNATKTGKRWNALAVEHASDGVHVIAENLLLRVRNDGRARSYVFRYKVGNKAVEIAIGSAHDVPLKEAKDKAEDMRTAVRHGTDPRDVLKPKFDPAAMTFRVYADQLIDQKKPHFRSDKHAKQWPATLEKYAYSAIGNKRPGDVTLADIEAILRPIWSTKTETATRLRSRIEAVLDFAFVAENIEKRNPARFRGNLEHRGFAQPRKIAPRKHHPAAHYTDMPAIMSELRPLDSTPALCLRFTILTWTRSSEVREAVWPEIDLDRKLWTIPAKRMKANKEHVVPLCADAVAILETMKTRKRKNNDAVFPGANGGLISDVVINEVLHNLPTVKGLDDAATARARLNAKTKEEAEAITYGATVHGFRSTARSWGAAKTSFAPFVLELALAHVNKDRVEAAYQRDTVIETRCQLMDAWENYCRHSNVVQFVKPNAV